jgi:hypothetical protein
MVILGAIPRKNLLMDLLIVFAGLLKCPECEVPSLEGDSFGLSWVRLLLFSPFFYPWQSSSFVLSS